MPIGASNPMLWPILASLGIRHHKIAEKVISADTKGIKIWDQDTGENHTSLETPADINAFCVVEDSGLILTACEHVDNGVYFIPSLAPAPKWAAYLDSITEELEEDDAPAVYDDFKFLTRKELEELGLEHLIGSNILRAYMHGFFMDAKLYREAKTIAKYSNFDIVLGAISRTFLSALCHPTRAV